MACIYTYKGKEFKTKADIVQFIKANKISPSEVNLARDVAFKTRSTGFTTVQEEDITNTLASNVLKHAKGDIENFGSTDFNEVISAYVNFHINKSKGTPYHERFLEVGKNIPYFVEQVKKFYKSKGLEIVEELLETEEGNLFIENALLIDPKQNASAKVRALVSLTPKYTRNENGRAVEDRNTFLGTPKFVSEGAMWNTLKKGLSDMPNPTFEKMLNKMEEMSTSHPSINKLKEALNKKKVNETTGQTEVDEVLRTQFFNSFALSRVEYMSVLLDGEPGEGMSVKISTTDPSSQQSMIVNNWVENFSFLNSHNYDGNLIYHAGKLDDALKSFEALENKVLKELKGVKSKRITDSKSVRGKNSNKLAEEFKGELIKALELLGIEMDIAGVNNLLRSPEFKSKEGNLSIYNLNRLMGRDGLGFLMSDISEMQKASLKKRIPIADKEGKTPLEDNKIIKLLAKKQGEVIQDLTEANTLGAEGNLYSNYSTHNLVSSLVSEWNDNTSLLDAVTSSAWGNGSRIAKWMKSDSKNNKLKAYVLNSLKSIGKGDQGSKPSDLSDPEAIALSVSITLSDGKTATYMGLAEADKSRQVVLKGGKFESSGITYRPEGTNLAERYTYSNENTINILSGYFADEVLRMQAVYKNLHGENAIPENEKVAYLHEEKNVHTSYLFPEFNVPDSKGVTPLEKFGIITSEKNEKGEVVRYIPKKNLVASDILSNRKLRMAIRDSFIRAVNSDVNILESNMLIQREVTRNEKTGAISANFNNVALDKNIIANRYGGSVVEAIADYTLNSIIGSIETTMLFTGDPASFKSSKSDLFKDFRKRIPLVISGGTKARVYKNKNTGNQDVRPFYTSSVVSNIENPSDYFFPTRDEEGNPEANQDLLDKMVKAFNEGKPEDQQATKEDMLNLIKGYSNVNATDAQAWITLDTFKERMLSFGKWTTAHQDAYERITKKKPKLLSKDVKLFMQPLKTVHVEEVSKHGHRYVHYNKQSEAVIIPGLFPGLDALQASSPEVDHFITLDGKKVGASGVAPINDGNNVLPSDQISLTTTKLSYNRLYLQQDLPTKQVKDTLVGSQVVKNLLGEIVLNAEYEIPLPGGKSKKLSGQDLVDQYHEVVGLLSDMGYNSIKDEFGYNEESGRISEEKFNDFLIKSMEDELTVSDVEALEAGLPIDMLPATRKKLESKLMAAIKKKTIKLKQLGGAMVQMSSFGVITDSMTIDGKVKDGIIWFKDVRDGLKPMQLKEDKDGKLYTEKAQIVLPHKMIVDLLGEGYKDMTPAQIQDKLSDPNILMGISYRIPNQATASNDLFEIVGILPPEAGDSIISYNEITTKTGSDFDIDKAYVILPNIEKDFKTGKIRRPRYAFEMSNKEAYNEKYNKDWSRSIRAREITLEIEASLKPKKDAIIAKMKELKGADKVTQSLRDISRNEDNVEENVITGDLVELLRKYFGGDLRTEALEEVAEKKRIRDQMLSLEGNLKKVDENVKEKLRERLIAEKLVPTQDEFNSMPEVKKHTKKALENLRLDLMQALLGDPKTYPNAVASLDNPFLEKEAKSLYASDSGAGSKNLGFFRGTVQAQTKVLFDKAKNLVGVIANNMTDHKATQSLELTYRNLNLQIGQVKDNESLVSAITDVNGVYTSTWLNLYMNAIVDAAKDPYIVAANINQFTAPVGFMLIRSGVPAEWVNAYMGQPILKELVKLKGVREGRFAQKIYDKETGKKVTPEQELINKYTAIAKIDIDQYNNLSLKDLKKLKASSLKAEIKNSKVNKTDALKQLIILKAFNEFKETSKDLNDSIRASKADVANGKDLMQAELKEAKLLQVIEKNAIRGVEKKFGAKVTDGQIEKDDKGFVSIDGSRMPGTFHKNGIQSAGKMFSGTTIMSSNAVRNLLFSTIFDLNPELVNREKEVDTIMNEIYSFIMGIEGAGITNGQIKNLFFGDNSVPRQLEKFKRSDPKFAQSNILLRDLTISYRKKEGDPDFLVFNNKNQDRELYQRAWEDLFTANPKLASSLVDYSYSSTGFNRNLFSFFQFIPTQEYINRGVGVFMENLKKVFTDTTVLENAKDQVIRHLSNNPKIIKTVASRDMKPIDDNINKRAAFILGDKTEYAIGKNISESIETARVLRDGNNNLYRLVGYHIEGPVYRAVSKLGYSSKGRVIKEYFTPNEGTGAAQASIVAKNKMIMTQKASFEKPDIFVPLSKLNEKTNEWLKGENIVPMDDVMSDLKESILARTKNKSEVTQKEVEEAKKICKIK